MTETTRGADQNPRGITRKENQVPFSSLTLPGGLRPNQTRHLEYPNSLQNLRLYNKGT